MNSPISVKLYPFTDDFLEEISQYDVVLLAEECVARGGIGEHLSFALSQRGWKGQFIHCGVDNTKLTHSTVPEMKEILGLAPEQLAQAVRGALERL